MPLVEDAIAYARAHQDAHLDDLNTLLRIPSISTLPENKEDVLRAAEWIADQLRGLNMTTVDIMSTPGHPVVYAESPKVDGAPTLLVYGHYDVQPVDPISEWVSDPFAPTAREDYLYARGASDMKGQLVAQLKAVEALVKSGALPVNLKYILEGEEEVGSPNLEAFINENEELLRADVVLNCDGGFIERDTPSITYALRGLAYFELEVRGPSSDLHSGLFGGTILNPAQALCEMIAGMHDADGKVTLPRFYDRVRDLDEEERTALARLPHSDDAWLALTGAPTLAGEEGYTTVERVGARPTLEVNGIWGGFTGSGSKTVLPAKASAKISMRLVADQRPDEIHQQLLDYLDAHTPTGVTCEVRELVHGPGAIMDRSSAAMQAAVDALEEVFKQVPVFKREGGSIPVVGMMQDRLGIDSVLLGFELPDDNIHGPNERQYIPNFFKGIETYIHFLTKVAK